MPLNFHPPFSAFPLALITVATLLEMFNFLKRSAAIDSVIQVNLLFAVLGVAAAFFSGYSASEYASQTFEIADEVISRHHSWGRLLLILIAPCLMMKVLSRKAEHLRRLWLALYLLLLLTCQGLVLYTGYLGGELVFTHGAGVNVKVDK